MILKSDAAYAVRGTVFYALSNLLLLDACRSGNGKRDR